MRAKRIQLSEQIRRAILNCGMSRYALGKMAGVPQSAMSRFVNRKGSLDLKTVDALADILNLNLEKKDR
jgi:transcriptional regulator with XRE-family HTH domain